MRVASSNNVGFIDSEDSGNDDDDDDDDNDDDDDDNDDDEYHPGSYGHRRKRAKTISLEYNVEELRSSFSATSDRRAMSSRTRTNHLSNFILKGGGNLYDVPCSQMSMIR